MTATPARRDDGRLPFVEQLHMTDSLVGSFFHSDASLQWQGCVVAEAVRGEVYLVELFEWLSGRSTHQRLVRMDDMTEWRFYDSAEWMREASDLVRRTWHLKEREL